MKNIIINQLVQLQKTGVEIYLTEAGWHEFVRLMQEEITVGNESENEAV